MGSGWIQAAIVIIGTIFNAGLMFGKVWNHDKRLDAQDGRLDTHEGRLNEHAVKIAKTEGWREGYSAAKDGHS